MDSDDLTCSKCGHDFYDEKALKYHVENKVCLDKKYFCKYCDKGFMSKCSMYRHTKHTCKLRNTEKGNQVDVYEKIKLLEEKNKKLESEVNKLKNADPNVLNNGTINNGTINNINDNSVTNNITIVAYGKEDMSMIDREEIIQALKTGFNSTKRLTEVVHFNPKYPHYSNIKRSNYNMKNKVMYHNGTKWVTTSDPHMIDELYYRKRDFIEENIDDYRDGLTKGDMTRLERWLGVDDDDHRIIKIKDNLREILFNKRDVSEYNEKNLNNMDPSLLPQISDYPDTPNQSKPRTTSSKAETVETETVKVENETPIRVSYRKRAIAKRNGKYRKTTNRQH